MTAQQQPAPSGTRVLTPASARTPVQLAWNRLRAHALVCHAPERCEQYRDLDIAYTRCLNERMARAGGEGR